MISYAKRVARMKVPGDEDKELKRAINYAKKLKVKSRKAGNLSNKIEIDREVKEAENVVMKLRLNMFELNEMLLEQVASQPVPLVEQPTKPVSINTVAKIKKESLFTTLCR